jgi:hypothetical protein
MDGREVAAMTLSNDEVEAPHARGQAVGEKIGRTLTFQPAPNPEHVFLMADTADDAASVSIYGPVRVDEVTIHEIDLLLDQLESGNRRIDFDEDGDPQLR